MKLEFSPYLAAQKPLLKRIVSELSARYPFVSVLGQDSASTRVSVSRAGISAAEDSLLTKRGFVLRIHNGSGFAEYSFNGITSGNADSIMSAACRCADSASGCDPVPDEIPLSDSWSSEYQCDPDEMGIPAVVDCLSAKREKALSLDSALTDFILNCSWQKRHTIYISSKRELTQSVLWTNAAMVALASDGSDMKRWYKSCSGLCGTELLDEITDAELRTCTDNCLALRGAEFIKPGMYDCICTPSVTGVIVHEAFGHGVEMDMFVKNRALAVKYMNKAIASPLVTMRDGALSGKECATYLFDDEGVSGSDTLVIDKGTLVSGYCDAVSAARLGVRPTGNGRRESFERKSYTRMTNTFFEGGTDTYEDMIASIKYGFLLDGVESGMEDPKNWGIQCMVTVAREISDGRLTGRVFSPVVLTGYVPDLLESISMISDKVKLEGSGFCGKGYKEWVKVSDGGAYIKARIRLG